MDRNIHTHNRNMNAEGSENGTSTSQWVKYIIILFINYWKWYLLSVIICLACAYVYKKSKPDVYEQHATILLEDADKGTGAYKNGTFDALKEMGSVKVTDELKNEMFIISSRRLMEKVVKHLDLNILYTSKQGLTPVTLYKDKPFTVVLPTEMDIFMSLQAHVEDNGSITISNLLCDKEELPGTWNITDAKVLKTKYGDIKIVPLPTQHDFKGWNINVTSLPIETAISYFVGKVSCSEYDKMANLINVSVTDVNKARAHDILTDLLKVYKQDIVDAKNTIAANTAEFIDSRMKIITEELSEAEGRLAEFKRNNKLIDFNRNAELYLQQSTTSNQKLTELETELTVAKYLQDYIMEKANNKNLIPQLTGLGNTNMQSQIARYNEMMMERNKLATYANENTTTMQDREMALASMRTAINASVESYIQTLRLQLQKAKSVNNEFSANLSTAPEKEVKALDITRQQQIKEALYTYLLNKREGVALQLAINEANVRVVEPAFGSQSPISRPLNFYLLIGLAIGLIIPSLIFWLLQQLNTKVRSREDVKAQLTAPMLGTIPNWEGGEKQKIITENDKAHPVSEALRIIRYGIDLMVKKPVVIMTTSSTPGQGKSFVARNLAIITAMTDKKVILVDADIRKGTLSKILQEQNKGLTTYLAEIETNLNNIIIKDELSNVDFIPAGVCPPNPAELLMSNNLEKLIEELKTKYDYIIIDSTPAFSVADASIVNRVADLTMFIIRVGVENINFLKEIESNYQEKKFKNLVTIVNGEENNKHSYHYGYNYGYSYGYSYGYGAAQKKKSLKKRLIEYISNF